MRRLLRGLGPNVIALGFTSFFTDLGWEMIFPLLPLYLTELLGAGTAFVGLVEGIAESTASILNAGTAKLRGVPMIAVSPLTFMTRNLYG